MSSVPRPRPVVAQRYQESKQSTQYVHAAQRNDHDSNDHDSNDNDSNDMASSSRGAVPPGLQSKSTPNLPTLRSLEARSVVSPPRIASPRSSSSSDDDAFALELSSSSSESGDEDSPPTSRPLYTSRSHTHLALPQPRPPASALYPPFYNRPPVPLPPSPSLTSLLRPSFSAAPSRPTTPDSSDMDLPLPTPTPTSSTTHLAHMTDSARNAPTVPRASPKVPTYEYYGFAVYLGSSAAFLMYVLWAYVPAPLLHQMGIWWYPDRWWALAVPCWLVVLVLWIYVALASYNTRHLTLPMASCENLVDGAAQVAVVDWGREREGYQYQVRAGDEVDWRALWDVGTDAVMDVPVGGVCEVLYGG